jgi:hypothetical protein
MKRSIEGNSSDQDGISCTQRRQIWNKWKEKKPLTQIAEETGETVETVYRILANMQKELTERIGVESYARQKSRTGGTRVATS